MSTVATFLYFIIKTPRCRGILQSTFPKVTRGPWRLAAKTSQVSGFSLFAISIHCTLPVVNCDCSSSALSGERLDDCLGNCVGVLVEHKVAAVEIAQVGLRHKLLHEFRGRRPDKRVISPPDDERLRLPVLQIGVPFRVVWNVRGEVHK